MDGAEMLPGAPVSHSRPHHACPAHRAERSVRKIERPRQRHRPVGTTGPMAPWSPLVWRSYNMKGVVSSTLAAETQSLLNGLGQAEWIAAHLAEMSCPRFAVDQAVGSFASLSLTMCG